MLRWFALILIACNHAVSTMKTAPDHVVCVGEIYGFDTSWTGPERVVDHPDCQKNRAGDCALDLRYDRVNFRLGIECDRACARWMESSWESSQFGMIAAYRAGPLRVRVTMIPHFRPVRVATYDVTVVDPTSIAVICMTEASRAVDCAAADVYKLEVHGHIAGRDYRAWGVEVDGVERLPANATEREYLVSELPHGHVQFALGTARTTVELR